MTLAAVQMPAAASMLPPLVGNMALPQDERLRRFGAELDKIRKRVEAEIGEVDVEHVKKLRRASTAFEVLGRGLIHFSFEPVAFTAGVISLWLHKQIEATEIGHTALHGAYDGLPGAEKFQSKGFNWRVPIDEESWHVGHNQRHHQYTNIAGKDADIHFGPVRLTKHTPYNSAHKWQLPVALLTIFPNFGFSMNMHFTGLIDVYAGNGRGDKFDFIPDRSLKSVVAAHKHALRKFVPYYAKEYVLFPLLAGPMFWKVALGNWISEILRDVYSAATIFCGHVGEEVAAYPEGTRAHGRGQWYAMQVESANNFAVPKLLSILCGGLDMQIEHHIFPKFAPERLRQVQAEVQKTCEEFGVEYRMESWPTTLKKALKHISNLSKETNGPVLAKVGQILEDMT